MRKHAPILVAFSFLTWAATAQTLSLKRTDITTAINPEDVAVGDFNGDGLKDIVVANSGASSMSVLLGNGDGTFQPPRTSPAGVAPMVIAAADLNGDGLSDVLVNDPNNQLHIFLSKGDGTFRPMPDLQAPADSIAVADLNKDGKPDIILGGSDRIWIFIGHGDGTFSVPSVISGPNELRRIAVADFNGDGKIDLAAMGVGNIWVLLGNGDGTLQSSPISNLPCDPSGAPACGIGGLATGDLNSDGFPDLVVAEENSIERFIGRGDGTFQTAPILTLFTFNTVRAVAISDLNSDGRADLLATLDNASIVCVFLARQDGTFAPVQSFPVQQVPVSIALGDFNRDGKPDIVTPAQGASGISVLVSTTGPSALGYYAVTPCRIIDTRYAPGAFGGPAIGAGQTRNLVIPSSPCGIPTTAQAYSLNITVAPHGILNYLTVWPTGQTQPLVSTLNAYDGAIVANAALVPAGTNGAISVFATDTTDVIIDINGYFEPPGNPGASAFYPIQPCRVADTRNPNGPAGGPSLDAGQARNFQPPSSCSSVPFGAVGGYALNMTVVPPGPMAYLSTWPAGQPQPLVSTLNSYDGRIVANAAIVPAGSNLEISVLASDATNLVMDINGYFAGVNGTGALFYYPLPPCRVADTRIGNGTFGGPAISGGSTRTFPIPSSTCNVPSTAQAYSLNFTAVPSGPLNYLTTWPALQPQPLVSTLNSYLGKVVANAAIVPAGSNGAIDVFVSDTTNLVLDINGYFAPAH